MFIYNNTKLLLVIMVNGLQIAALSHVMEGKSNWQQIWSLNDLLHKPDSHCNCEAHSMSAFYLHNYHTLDDSMLNVRDDLFLSIVAFFRKTHHSVQLLSLNISNRGNYADKTRQI